eukprot:Skav215130  [mRNA]  locus=scaffold1164:48736:49275:+ [translate_table: standard]
MKPVGKVQEAVVHGDQKVRDETRHMGQGPARHLNRIHFDHCLGDPFSFRILAEAYHFGAQSTASVAFGLVRVVHKAHFQRNGTSSHIKLLLQGAVRPIPNVELASIKSLAHMSRVEALCEAIRIAPLRGDHDIVPRLIPEVISKTCLGLAFPSTFDLESLWIEGHETSSFGLEAILRVP